MNFPEKSLIYINKNEKIVMVPSISDDGLTLTYGLYPQTHISDESLLRELNKLTRVESNGWFRYEGEYYAQLTAKPFDTSYTFVDGVKVIKSTQYRFKCEPIIWKILESKNDEYLLISNILLDAHNYNGSISFQIIDKETIYCFNYKYSDIRTWLNDEFYDTAFNLNYDYIQTTVIDSKTSIEDKVFLLSNADYSNSNYGFSKTLDNSNTRTCKITDYSLASGVFCKSLTDRNGFYWTKSPYSYENKYYGVYAISYSGALMHKKYNSDSYLGTDDSGICVRLAITIKIN